MDSTTVLIIAGICGVVGLVLGLVLGKTGNNKSEGRRESGSSVSNDSPYRDVLRVVLDPEGKSLMLLAAGQTFRSAAEMSPSLRQKVERATVEWLRWMGIGIPGSTTAAPPVQTQPANAVLPPAQTPPAKPAPSTNPPAQPAAPAAPPAPAATRVEPPVEIQPSTSGLGIVDQINQILREKTAGTKLESSGVRLMQLTNQNIVFYVGLTRYESLEAIPDPDIRAAIRAAVSEWERRSK